MLLNALLNSVVLILCVATYLLTPILSYLGFFLFSLKNILMEMDGQIISQ